MATPDLHAEHVAVWFEHILHLADHIGPRGSTTEAEQQASDYCAAVYRGLGYTPAVESFTSAVSIYHPHLLAAGAIFIAWTLYPLAPLFSGGLALIAFASDLLELGFMPNPLRWIVPKGRSQNVIATLPPLGEHRQDLILIGHVDSHRTPIIFRSRRWLDAYKAFTTLAAVIFAVTIVLFFVGAVTGWPWVWPVTGAGAICALLLVALCVQADLTPFSHGANDNATAAGLVLTLAGHLLIEPLRHTRVWFVNTGCEEVQHYGAIDFFRRHRADLVSPRALVFEMLGCAGPAWLVQEGIVIPFRASPDLIALAQRLADRHPEWRAHPATLNGGNTEMADALRAGVPAITFIGADEHNNAPYWHQSIDTVDKMDADVMKRAYAMTWAFIRALDEG
ncbi:MAG: M28 family peptidase [Anaerolineae bacterium]